MEKEVKDVVGYLPNEKPTLGKAIVFALQQFLVMLPATVLAAILMNSNMEIYSISAAVIASGFATISFLIITKFRIPLYYGSSFSYIPAVGIVTGYALSHNVDQITTLGAIIIASILSGLMSILAGFLIKKFGKETIDKILPGHITGMIAMIIGLSLARTTLQSLTNSWVASGDFVNVDWLGVLTGLVAFAATVTFTVVLKKGFISQVPILLGAAAGVVFAYLVWVPFSAGGYQTYFSSIKNTSTLGLLDVMPWKTLPAAFSNIGLIGVATIAIFPIAFATIPESSAHVNQIDLYVNQLAKEKEEPEHDIKSLLGDNLIGDGTADIVAVVLGGPAGTNYGENISASAVTKNFSSYVFFITGILAIVVGVLLEILGLGNLSLIITNPVIQGISIYLFGAIAVQGIALMIEKKVDVFDPKVVAVMAFIAIVGLGVNSITLSDTFMLPGIGIAAIGGILLNLVLNLIDRPLKDKEVKEE